MPLPLLWLGAAAVSALAIKSAADDRKKAYQDRRLKTGVDRYSGEHGSAVGIYPTDLFHSEVVVEPEIGSVVCCGIGGLFEHTGIWVGDNTIVELDGNGLIKPISARRFLGNRSGDNIFVACDSNATPLALPEIAHKALDQIYQYEDYHLIENNCHQFIWHLFDELKTPITSFSSLNENLAKYYDRVIYWDLAKIDDLRY
ncbi:hypothetical protein tloyanaT_30450 [Thalassotalea loyana]|uniref:LRAT domain-containing protein n=1 Tax=Thalassotalea loyana TaxID=280483 RepID=A0ABQ6HIX8_9GAMM|nr:hypothetical protein [Thalassotalea loyana]GLX86792.1 hypothetical protein tloyanaT_30450 [Thalassotalea loyana]